MNPAATGQMRSPLLYLRGQHEGGDIDAYVAGSDKPGWPTCARRRLPVRTHFAPEDAPDAVWAIADFITNSSPL